MSWLVMNLDGSQFCPCLMHDTSVHLNHMTIDYKLEQPLWPPTTVEVGRPSGMRIHVQDRTVGSHLECQRIDDTTDFVTRYLARML